MGKPGFMRDPVLLAYATLAVLSVPWLLLGLAPRPTSWAVQTVLDVALVWSGGRLARLATGQRHARRFWRALQVAMLCCTAGDAYQTILVVRDPSRTDVSVLQTVMVVVAMTIMAATMLRHPLGATGRQRLRLWLDAITVLAGVAIFLWYFSLAPQLSGAHAADRYVAAASAAVMLVVVFGVLKLVFSDPPPFTLSAGLVASVGITTTALGTSVSLVLTGGRIAFVVQVLSCTPHPRQPPAPGAAAASPQRAAHR
ncbi:hypothetical protein GCM10010435_91100 [Winogradskya consettensis]|uniref:Uncharacterized protein n=2 Tax=Winogradskya consettensis TaxID=113560 RepID=A0A919SKW8_9ACTN|nr:hypothetical protein Aco04nite_34670 [Actinoplanes consettensis]